METTIKMEITIKAAKTGWIVDYHSNATGNTTGARWLLSYKLSGFDKDANLTSPYNNIFSIAGMIAAMARKYGRRLKKGVVVQ